MDKVRVWLKTDIGIITVTGVLCLAAGITAAATVGFA